MVMVEVAPGMVTAIFGAVPVMLMAVGAGFMMVMIVGVAAISKEDSRQKTADRIKTRLAFF